MSALGQKQTFAVQTGMSALPPKADMQQTRHYTLVTNGVTASYVVERGARQRAATPLSESAYDQMQLGVTGVASCSR